VNEPDSLPDPVACNDPAHKLASDAACTVCGSLDVELAFPAFFRASDGALVSVDFEAVPLRAWCPKCKADTSASFAP